MPQQMENNDTVRGQAFITHLNTDEEVLVSNCEQYNCSNMPVLSSINFYDHNVRSKLVVKRSGATRCG